MSRLRRGVLTAGPTASWAVALGYPLAATVVVNSDVLDPVPPALWSGG
ncbi:hypothetical protein [Streptomyces sp. NPDC018693]